jgi:hypothetical protein
MLYQSFIILFACFSGFVSGFVENTKDLKDTLLNTTVKVKLTFSVICMLIGISIWLSYVWRNVLKLICRYVFLVLGLTLMAIGLFIILQIIYEQLNSTIPPLLKSVKGSASTTFKYITSYLLAILVGMLLQCWGTFHAWIVRRYRENNKFQENWHTNQHISKTNQRRH